MSLIKIEGVASTSAPTKAQKDAAVYLFGSKGHSIVAVLDKFSRAKELRTAHLDGLLKLMKEGEDDDIIKFGASALGKKTIQNAKAFAVAKTLTASIKALKLIRVPVKWIDGHSDVAAARAQETKEIRARRTASNKPEKPIKLDNPGAPEAVKIAPTKANAALSKVWNLSDFSSNLADPSWNKLVTEFNKEFAGRYSLKLNRKEGAFRINTLTGGYSGRGEAFLSMSEENGSWVMFANDPAARGGFSSWYVGPKLTLATVASYMINELAGDHSPEYAKVTEFLGKAKVFKTQEKYWEPLKSKQPKAAKAKAAKAKVESAPAKEAYTPSGKSDMTLVDELAEVTARKIAAKPLQAREEYFNALRNTLHSNLRNSVANTTSDGVTVALGSKLYTIRLSDNAWTIQTGVTGKQKKIGATFDIVDLLGMMDKSILRPKA